MDLSRNRLQTKNIVPKTLLWLVHQISPLPRCHGTVPIPESKQKDMGMRTAYSFLPKMWKDAFLWTESEDPSVTGRKKMMPKNIHDALWLVNPELQHHLRSVFLFVFFYIYSIMKCNIKGLIPRLLQIFLKRFLERKVQNPSSVQMVSWKKEEKENVQYL